MSNVAPERDVGDMAKAIELGYLPPNLRTDR
jgi:hypothetical protein